MIPLLHMRKAGFFMFGRERILFSTLRQFAYAKLASQRGSSLLIQMKNPLFSMMYTARIIRPEFLTV